MKRLPERAHGPGDGYGQTGLPRPVLRWISPGVGLDLYECRAHSLAEAEPVRASRCPACDGDLARSRFTVDGVEAPIRQCTGCGSARFEPMLDPRQIEAFYPADYYGEPDQPGSKFHPWIEWLVRVVAARHVAFIAAGLQPGARVLDVGCGRGVILGPLADRGFEVHGLEVSEAATQGADSRAKITIAPRLVDADYEAGCFDQIIIWHVLEHLPDPLGTLSECRRILRPGGRLVVAVPNFSSWQAKWSDADWFHLDPPRHLHHFSQDGLRRLVERSGFDCVSQHHFSLRQNPFGWIQSVLNRMAGPDGRPNRLYSFLQGIGPRASRGSAIAFWLQLAMGALPALALSVAAAVFKNGATVHVVALRRESARGQ